MSTELLAPVVPALLLSEKVTAAHRSRDAYVYVRQSTPSQVVQHVESLARQYELRERAVGLGWPARQVVVIDADLGRSGAEATKRPAAGSTAPSPTLATAPAVGDAVVHGHRVILSRHNRGSHGGRFASGTCHAARSQFTAEAFGLPSLSRPETHHF